MRRFWKIICGSVAALLLVPAFAAAADIEIVIDRKSDSVEIFFATSATNFEPIFGHQPDGLTGPDGTVGIETLRQGTWDIGDDLLSKVRAKVGDDPLTLETMSLMVHPQDQRLPLSTPLDGVTSTAVCNAVDPGRPLTIEDLHGYVGLIAFTDSPDGALSFQLPSTGRETVDVTVRDFRDWEFASSYQATIADGGVISVGPVAVPAQFDWAWVLFGAALVAAGIGVWTVRRRFGGEVLRVS